MGWKKHEQKKVNNVLRLKKKKEKKRKKKKEGEGCEH